LILNNAAQSVGNLRSLYSGSSSGPINQEIHLHGTILSITQTVDADYGISPADGTTPTPSDSVISGTGGIVLTTASTHELSLSDPNNTYSGPTAINGGSLAISTDTNLGTAPGVSTPGQLTVNGGQFHAVGGSPLMLAPTRGFTVGPNGGTLRTDAGTPLTIQGVTTFSNAASTLTVAANSSVRFISSANATAVAVGSSVTVASGATLELAGTASALSDGTNNVNVVNNSRATGGGMQATGTNQSVGFISGTGDTAVAAGSDLTADGIIQNSLTIGGSAGNLGLVTIRASSSVVMAGDPAGGADGLVVAGSLAPSAPFGSDVSGASLAGEVGGAAVLGDFASPALGTASGGSAAVPEPATWLLALLAVAGLAVARRFRHEIGRGNRVAVGG
jgi:autotransporter-associated beta strand protein